ncbi:MAG: TonB-dependent siderophore receptor [Hyphomicrobiaceae bacterium]|nr:TonB-dependent siderophore receptor [Hyphomicrobiaceae bacterium]
MQIIHRRIPRFSGFTARLALSTSLLALSAHSALGQQSATPLETITVQGETNSGPGGNAGASASAGTIQTEPVLAAETAWGPVDGYVATISGSATKTGTPLIETPQSISVVTADQIEAQQATSFTEALRYVPGVTPEAFGFEPRFAWIKIRGIDVTTDGLYKDGLQLRNPGFITSYSPEPYGAERIEIPRGPSSVLYGAGTVGGLVNYISKRPVYERFREIEVEGGSHDFYQGKFDFGGHVDEAGTFLYRMTGVVRDADTQIDFIQNDRIFLAPAITWRPSDRTQLTVLAHYQDDDTKVSGAVPAEGLLTPNPNGKISPSLFTGEPTDVYERDEHSVTTLFEHHLTPDWTFRQNARYLNSKLVVDAVYSIGLQADLRTLDRAYYARDNKLKTFNIDNQLIGDFNTGSIQHTLLLGFDYQYLDGTDIGRFGGAAPLDIFAPVYGNQITVSGFYSNQDIEQSQTGLYVQDQIKFTPKWILTLGGRNDWAETTTDNFLSRAKTKIDDREFSGRAGLVFKSNSGIAPYVSYSESFLPVGGTDINGDTFDPETGHQYEAGIKYQPPGSRILLTAAVFDLTRENYTTTNPATFFPEQTGEVNSRGIELSATASLSSGLDLIASFTDFDLEITKSANPLEVGKKLLQTPETTASIWADYTFQYGSLEGFGFGGGVRYIGDSFADTANAIKIPDVTLADAAVHYERGNMRLALNVQNVFDKEYASGCFVRATTLCPFGATRNVTASLKLRW